MKEFEYKSKQRFYNLESSRFHTNRELTYRNLGGAAQSKLGQPNPPTTTNYVPKFRQMNPRLEKQLQFYGRAGSQRNF